MSLTITHMAGPLADQSQEFDDQKTRIVFGRNEALCDVVYPADYNIVAREHFALDRKFGGSYEVDLNKANYVEIDGSQAYESDPIPNTCQIRLGGPDGPLLQIDVRQAAESVGPPPTTKQKTMRSLADVSNRTRRLALVIGVVAVIAVAGTVGYTLFKQQEWKDLAASVEDVRKTQQDSAERLFTADVLSRLKDSVYLVVKQDKAGKESGFATAFAIGPNVLATNAHVAKVVLSRELGLRYYVSKLNKGSIKKYQITKAHIHPGYAQFAQFKKKADLVVPRAKGEMRDARFATAYDVALLYVESNSVLKPNLQLADNKTLHEITAGDPLAYAGFPMENLVGGAASALAPEPQLQIGILTSTTNFFNFPAHASDRQLLRHSMGATGGASGSPIINSKGQVVGALNAGNLFFLPAKGGRGAQKLRVPNAVNINFAQRADLIQELVSGTAKKQLAAYQKSWARDAAQFVTWKDGMAGSFDRYWKSKAKGRQPKTIFQDKGTLNTFRLSYFGFGARKNIKISKGFYGFQAISDRQTDINLYLYQGRKLVKFNAAKNSVPHFHHRFVQDTALELVVTSPKKKGAEYELKIIKLD